MEGLTQTLIELSGTSDVLLMFVAFSLLSFMPPSNG
jgi:hypothetical protein